MTWHLPVNLCIAHSGLLAFEPLKCPVATGKTGHPCSVGSATLLKTPPPPIGVSGAHILAEAKNQAVPLRGRTRHELNQFGRSMWSACASKNRQSRSRLKGRRGPQEMFCWLSLKGNRCPKKEQRAPLGDRDQVFLGDGG